MSGHSLRTGLFAATAAAALMFAVPAFAEEMKFMADLMPAEGVDSDASGSADVSYDTDSKMLTWTITYSSLTGEANAAHFHGPAAEGEDAPPVVPIPDAASGAEGSAELTDEQASQLEGGMWYVNIHTAEYPDGEIRGQVVAAE